MDMDDESVAENDELISEDEGTLHISECGFWTGTESLVDVMLPERQALLPDDTTMIKSWQSNGFATFYNELQRNRGIMLAE